MSVIERIEPTICSSVDIRNLVRNVSQEHQDIATLEFSLIAPALFPSPSSLARRSIRSRKMWCTPSDPVTWMNSRFWCTKWITGKRYSWGNVCRISLLGRSKIHFINAYPFLYLSNLTLRGMCPEKFCGVIPLYLRPLQILIGTQGSTWENRLTFLVFYSRYNGFRDLACSKAHIKSLSDASRRKATSTASLNWCGIALSAHNVNESRTSAFIGLG
jgi:hypothetical protein